ncbi:MAG TPA: TIM-barrel domain-containing protein [Actinomycetales bacterium]|nr:TIM-barrel domain-containing protein [Actinomycetales bacterium]
MRRAPRVLLAALAAAVSLGALLAGGYPQLRERRDASDLEPGLVNVAPVARGAVSLGNGVYAQLGGGGLTVNRRSAVVWRGVDRGSPVTAGVGRLRWRGQPTNLRDSSVLRADEQVSRSLGNLLVTGRRLEGSSVTWTGTLTDASDDPGGTLPVTLTVTRRERDSRVLLDVSVPGADVVAVHEYRRDGYTIRGLGAQGVAESVEDGRYPVLTRADGTGRGRWPLTAWQDLARNGSGGDAATTSAPVPAYLSSAGSGLALDTTGYAVVDLRHRGRVDSSVWSDRLRARVYDGTPGQMLAQHATDVGVPPAPPEWATSGAVVGVRGSVTRIRSVVNRLTGAQADLAAVLVRDGGARRRYPGWATMVDRLRGRDVRVLTSVSGGFALRSRAGGPDDEPGLLATARARGWLVEDASGRPATVRLDDPDAGGVAGALLDLTDPAAVDWYTGVLAARMRADGVSGWSVEGGDELPVTARLAAGNPVDAHNSWPRRLASLTRAACVRAGRPDCLLVQRTADERTAALTGVLSLGGRTAGWSAEDGLAGVLPATFNAGLAGLGLVSSGIGGTSAPAVPLWPDERRSDELLARWAELELFGPLLRTEDGDRPDRLAQVWDSPTRLRQFAALTRLFAATAQYRRQAIAAARRSGAPLVRPVWAEYPRLRQGSTAGQLLMGRSVLAKPVVSPGEDAVTVGLPPGTWVELFSGRRHVVPTPPEPHPGERPEPVAARQVQVPAPVGRPAVLYRADDPDAASLRRALRAAGLLG